MSEEEKVDEKVEQKEEPNVGNSLLNSLFAAADQPEEVSIEESEPQEERDAFELDPNAPLNLTEILKEPTQEIVKEEVKEEEEQKEEVVEEKPDLTKFDKNLFEGNIELPKPEEVEDNQAKEEVQVSEEEIDPTRALTEDQIKRYELARFAEENFKEYKGLSNEYLEFFKEQKKYIDERLRDDPDAKFDEADYEYQNFLKRKKPKFENDDLEKVVEFRTRKQTKEETLNEIKPEIDALKEQQKVLRAEPIVRELKKKTMEQIKDLIPDQLRQSIEKKGHEHAYNQDPITFDIVNKVATFHQEAMFAFHEISNGTTKFDPQNEIHIRFATWLDNLQNSMPEKDGKAFVRREKFHSLTAKERSKSYTLSDEDIIQKAHDAAKVYINSEINAREEKLRQSGWTRVQNPESQSVASIPKQPKPAPREGHSVGSEKPTANAKNPVLTALGL